MERVATKVEMLGLGFFDSELADPQTNENFLPKLPIFLFTNKLSPADDRKEEFSHQLAASERCVEPLKTPNFALEIMVFSLVFLVLSTALVGFIFITLMFQFQQSGKCQKIPGSYGILFFGEVLEYFRNPIDFSRYRFNKHGNIFKTRFFGSEVVFVRGMKAIQLFEKGTDLGLGASPEAYLSDALIYAFHPSKRRTVLMSENDHQHHMKHITLKTTSAMLFSQPGFLSIRIRDAMTKWFISASIPSNGAISGAPVNGVQLVKDIFMNLAVAVLFREVVNKDRLENLLLNWFQMNISWPMELFGLAAWSKGQSSMKELESFLTTEIRQRIHSGKGYGNDLIGCYLSTSEKWCDPSKGKAIDSVAETTVLTDCFTFVDSFCNNIACACVWFLVCLEQAPGIKQVLITEVRNFQGEFDIPAIQSTSVLPYLSATIEETLRIYGFLRQNALKRVALFDLEFDEYTIPKGTPVYLPLGTLNFNEENFHSATTFDPLRFMPGGVNHETDGAYSFGLGHHICPGAILARSILMVFAFTLLEGFDTSAKLDQSFEPVFQRVFTSSSSNVTFPYPADGLVYTSVTPRPARVETMLRSR